MYHWTAVRVPRYPTAWQGGSSCRHVFAMCTTCTWRVLRGWVRLDNCGARPRLGKRGAPLVSLQSLAHSREWLPISLKTGVIPIFSVQRSKPSHGGACRDTGKHTLRVAGGGSFAHTIFTLPGLSPQPRSSHLHNLQSYPLVVVVVVVCGVHDTIYSPRKPASRREYDSLHNELGHDWVAPLP